MTGSATNPIGIKINTIPCTSGFTNPLRIDKLIAFGTNMKKTNVMIIKDGTKTLNRLPKCIGLVTLLFRRSCFCTFIVILRCLSTCLKIYKYVTEAKMMKKDSSIG